jgi:hypothetical protein
VVGIERGKTMGKESVVEGMKRKVRKEHRDWHRQPQR